MTQMKFIHTKYRHYDLKRIRDEYDVGESSFKLTNKYNVPATTMLRWLNSLGKMRKRSDYNMTEETKRNISIAKKGVPLLEEARKNIVAAAHLRKGMKKPQEWIARGWRMSDDAKRRIADSKEGIPRSNDVRKKITETMNTPASRNKRSNLMRGRVFSEQHLKNLRLALSMRKVVYNKPTKIEIKTENELKRRGLKYIGPGKARIGPHVIDFFLTELCVGIECDGIYWHSLPRAIKKDAEKDVWFLEHNIPLLRLSEGEINKGDFTKLDGWRI